MISPEMKKKVLGTIRSKRGQFDPNSTRFNIKLIRIRDQIRAKIGSNKGLTIVTSDCESCSGQFAVSFRT